MIARFLHQNPLILFLVLCVIAVAGGTSYVSLPRLEDPVLGKRVAVISTVYPGADSRQVEALVTIPLEEKLQGIPEIKEVRSNCLSAISNTVIELHDHVEDPDNVWSIVRTSISDAQQDLPDGCLEPVFEVFSLKAYATIVALKWRGNHAANRTLLRELTRELRSRIRRIPGTESVDLFGDPGEEYLVEIPPTVLAALELPTAAIAEQITSQIVSQPAGTLRGEESELQLELKDPPSPEQALQETFIQYGPRGEKARLGDISEIGKHPVNPPRDLALIDGRRAFVLGAFVDDRMRVDRWWNTCQTIIEEFQEEYRSEVEVDVVFSQHDYIDARMQILLRNLMLGAAGVAVVVFLMMGWKSMLVVGLTLPLSCLLVHSGMHLLEIPLHQMSISGLIVALGLLIDNAIVIVEDVRSRMTRGDSAETAIAAGIRHFFLPLLASTLTTALAFTPIATLPGPPGEFVGTIAISVILAISASFLLAMTVVPALLGWIQVPPGKRDLFHFGFTNHSVEQFYKRSLQFVFQRPVLGLLIGVAFPALGFVVARELPEQFFPPSDRNQIQIEIELPARESIEKTFQVVQKVDHSVRAKESVRRAHWFAGRSAPTFYYNVVPRRRGTPYYAQAIVELSATKSIANLAKELQQELDVAHPDCRIVVRQLEQGPPFDAPVEIRIAGPNLQVLQDLGTQVRLLLSQTPNVLHTRSDLEQSIPKLVLELDDIELSKAGLNRRDINRFLYTTLEGMSAGEISFADTETPVRVRMQPSKENSLKVLSALQVPSMLPRVAKGPPDRVPVASPPPLGAISNLQLVSEQAAIVRVNGKRTNEVKAYITAGVLPSRVVSEFKRVLEESKLDVPPSYEITFAGERAERSNAVESLFAKAFLLFALVILTLVVSFRSLRCATIILIVGGLAAGLGPFALWAYGFPFGFMAIVGTMGLVGVAINDSIVVLAALRENQDASCEHPAEPSEVVSGCTRHVLTTTLTTIVGFLPLILSGGGFWPPLAITIAGGVLGATFLALYFVPCLYLLLGLNRRQ